MSTRDTLTRRVRIDGHFAEARFLDWIEARAIRLSISGEARVHGNTCIELQLTGERVLLDAMEVACSLGPADARVDGVAVLSEDLVAEPARQALQFVRHSAATS